MIITDTKSKIQKPKMGYNNYFDFEKFTPEVSAIAHGNHKPYACDISEAVAKAYEKMSRKGAEE